MTRDEIILSCQDIVKNLVRKYNNHKLDEDLVSVGTIASVECVDKCLADGMTDINQIKAMCNVWVRNTLLMDIYRGKVKVIDDDTAIDLAEAPEDLWETIECVKRSLGPRGREVFELLLDGRSEQEIMAKLGISEGTCKNHFCHIRQKIYQLPEISSEKSI